MAPVDERLDPERLHVSDAFDVRDAGWSGGRMVVLGASAGGVEALQRVVRHLPPSFAAPVVVVVHVPPTAFSRLPDILVRAGPLPARHVVDGQHLEPGMIHVAPPDRHVITNDGRLTLVDGPRENGVRPAIDPLFRSAARHYADGLIAAVLSGTLDDGTAGLAAVHANGGITVAQEPSDAICPGMPLNAIENTTVDYVVPADDMGDLFVTLLGQPPNATRRRPQQQRSTGSKATDLVCPECGGVLRQFDENGVIRFHCRVGHNYSQEALYSAHDARLEAAMWSAIRALEEAASMANRLSIAARERGANQTARRFDDRERDAAERADIIRSAILTLSGLDETPDVGEAEPVAHEDEEIREALRIEGDDDVDEREAGDQAAS
jgi:two-component system chemotaxis response regulator CheB